MIRSLHNCEPHIRVAHHYRFPMERNASESGRIGYCYALHLVEGGKGTAIVAGITYPLAKGDLLFIPPQVPHAFRTGSEQPLRTYNIYGDLWASSPFATEQHLVWNAADFNPALLTPLQPEPLLDALPALLPLQQQPQLSELFALIVGRHQAQLPHSAAICGSLLKALLLELAQLPLHMPAADYRMRQLMERIDREASGGARYDSWLAQSGLRKTQFHELFKQVAGMPPKAYWTRAVMKQAAIALSESSRSVTEIADHLGYSSIHHFTKQFTAYYGISPTQYRKRL